MDKSPTYFIFFSFYLFLIGGVFTHSSFINKLNELKDRHEANINNGQDIPRASKPLNGSAPTIDDCGLPNMKITFSNISFSPYPPIIGKNLEVSISGEASEDLDTLTLHLDGNFQSIPIVLDQSLCEFMACPIKAGPFGYSGTVSVPSLLWPGTFEGKVELLDSSDVVTCKNIKFEVENSYVYTS